MQLFDRLDHRIWIFPLGGRFVRNWSIQGFFSFFFSFRSGPLSFCPSFLVSIIIIRRRRRRKEKISSDAEQRSFVDTRRTSLSDLPVAVRYQKHKRLIDTTCQHEKCYSCMFQYEQCSICLSNLGKSKANQSSKRSLIGFFSSNSFDSWSSVNAFVFLSLHNYR